MTWLQKLVYMLQANLLKEVRIDQYCKMELNVFEKYYS
jgi:hypothetical protein